jgi:hypothetical protein
VILTGSIGEPKRFDTRNGFGVGFGVRTDNYKDSAGAWQNKWDNVVCWNAVAEYAQTLQSRDVVMVIGIAQEQDYQGEKKIQINAEFILKLGQEGGGMQTTDIEQDGFVSVEVDEDLPF